uniref:polysaccharide biosynthesis/export family protein n=1 Tax=Ningiella ruwaisensis TaxID=2364274 RepID=UPI00109FC5BB|nr:polysaccharide biosynthesis/export family protein [Ningiella ruwaisensis]
MRKTLSYFLISIYLCIASTSGYANQNEFVIGVGDTLAISVYNEPDLFVNTKVDSSGLIKMPLLGDLNVAGKTAKTISKELEAMFADGYLVNPNVSVTVESFRPFYIRGEVTRPGAYETSFGMTVEQAFTIAGGLTDRASSHNWLILREGQNERIKANKDTFVMPGDTVEIGQSFF